MGGHSFRQAWKWTEQTEQKGCSVSVRGPELSWAPSSSKCNSLMHKNIHFGFNCCIASHLCSTQINSKSSKSRKFVCYEPLLKFPEHQFLCSVSVRGPRASRAPSMLGSFPGLVLGGLKFQNGDDKLCQISERFYGFLLATRDRGDFWQLLKILKFEYP